MMDLPENKAASDAGHLSATVRGRVQGVYFRYFVRSTARKLGLTGYVHNLASGDAVGVEAEGPRRQLDELLESLKIGPPGARVMEVEITWSDCSGGYTGFDIRH
jgi:acylphosphatase